MTVKEFLKPTKWKIILTFIIPFYIAYIKQYAMVIEGPGVWWAFTFGFIPLIILIPGTIYSYFFRGIYQTPLTRSEEAIQALLMIMTTLIINYLIACLIIFLYNKFKTPSKI